MGSGIVFREAFRGLGRNVTMTIALIITSAISLALMATGLLVTDMTARTKDIYLDRVETIVQFDDEISQSDVTCQSEACKAVQHTLESRDGIDSITFRSREQSYERFVELFGETDPQLVAATSEDALPAALHVRLANPLDASALDGVESMDHVLGIIDQNDDVQAATKNLDAIRNATFIIAGIQAIAAIFLIANMVQIAAFNRREETRIMRVVGASRWYTQAPFIVEAVVAALIGAVFAVAGLIVGNKLVVQDALRDIYSSQLIAPVSNADIWALSPIIAIVGAVFAAITAQITLRLYVRT